MSIKPEHAAESTTPLPTYRQVAIERVIDGNTERTTDCVAEEVPLALLYQSVPHVVMMATPADLEDLAVGFTLSEGIVGDANEIRTVARHEQDGSLAVDVQIAGERFSALLRRQRNLTGRTGCGLCGVETVEEAMRRPPMVAADIRVSSEELHVQLQTLRTRQALNLVTGSVHAVAWAVPGKGIQLVREDVGRHNAMDKVIGALIRAGIDARDGYFIITSRASYEMVLKAAMVGVSFVAAVSAPTSLAITLAEETNVTLLGFARERGHVIYAHPQRVQD